MAITEKELEISNQSYTNKDFQAIYSELITFADKLSKRYSPIGSNESDPFVVLLKLAAFVSDKVNYNLDKNILERFILSCTQEQSMRDITSRLGYNMHYYIASATDVVFRYSFSDTSDFMNVYIPRFSILTNEDTIQYVTVLPTSIDRISGESAPVKALQGKLKTLDVLGNTVVKLENLNSSNIIYFPERRVAENGVFINIDSSQEWVKCDNIHSEVYGSRVYKFGFDSIRNLPFLEFPEWIADIIDDGLTIQYIVTDGEQGNISARALKTLTRSISDGVSDSEIQITNLSAADTGKDPETLDETYQGFKKVIGTFDTLVTCRDYANKIYQLIDSLTDDPIVSNVQVGDRRNDINYSCSVVTLAEGGDVKLESIPFSSIDAFKLYIYGLNPYSQVKQYGYIDSYRLLPKDKLADIEDALHDSKTICHNFNILDYENQDEKEKIGAIEIEVLLSAVISTNKKVNSIELSEIIQNVINALANKYNARNLDFGYEIPFDELLETMQNADERIKNVSLLEPKQTPTFITPEKSHESSGNNLSGEPIYESDRDSSEQYKFIVAKNVLAGTIPLFEYDDDFAYDYKQTDSIKVIDVKKIGTMAGIEVPQPTSGSTDSSYVLKANEAIQFLAPSLITEVTYPYAINYYAENLIHDYIPKGSTYQLEGNEKIIFTYQDNNGDTIIKVYDKNSNRYICPNFDLYNSSWLRQNRSALAPTLKGVKNSEYPSIYDNTEYWFYTIGTKEEVAIKKISADRLTVLTKCYWLIDFERSKWRSTADSDIEISFDEQHQQDPNYYTNFTDPDSCELILDENDYFFYSDMNLTTLMAFGSGTKLVCNGFTANYIHAELERVDVQKVTQEGLRALKPLFTDIPFNNVTDHPENNMTLLIYENDIITATTEDTLRVTFEDSLNGWAISDNVFKPLPSTIISALIDYSDSADSYQLGDKSTLPLKYQWQARALLDINAGPTEPLTLEGNQLVEIKDPSISIPQLPQSIIGPGLSFMFNILTQIGGAENIDLSYTDLNQETAYPNILIYEQLPDSPSGPYVTKVSNEFYKCNFIDSGGTKQCILACSPIEVTSNILVRYVAINLGNSGNNPSGLSPLTYIEFNGNGSTGTDIVTKFIPTSPQNNRIEQGTTILKIEGDVSVLTLTPHLDPSNTIDDIIVLVGNLELVQTNSTQGLNEKLGLRENDNFIGHDGYLETCFPDLFNKFYATHSLDSSRLIEVSNEYKLNSAQAFYDQNNVVNKWVIPRIDFENSKITIAHSSKA